MTATREITSTPGEVWARASAALRQELGENAFASWLAQAAVWEGRDGRVALVAPTGFARDWIRRNASRRVAELWAANDPLNRPLDLKCRAEVDAASGEADAAATPCALPSPAVPVAAPAVQAVRGRASGLQDRWTFDTFVSGPSNEFAHSVARTVASWADGHFNPVVIHGPYGFGKTHLLNAMALEAQRTQPGKTVLYMTSERFLSGFVRAVMDRSTAGFKEELRAADLLLIDDVHFIAGKPSSQEELLQTLSALMEDGKRVVLPAIARPRPGRDGAAARSHLCAGLVCGIEPADRALRVGIIERKLGALGARPGLAGAGVQPEVLQFMADRFSESVRELEGALNTLVRPRDGRSAACRWTRPRLPRPHLRRGTRVTWTRSRSSSPSTSAKQATCCRAPHSRGGPPRQIAIHLAKSPDHQELSRHRPPFRRARPHHRPACGAHHRASDRRGPGHGARRGDAGSQAEGMNRVRRGAWRQVDASPLRRNALVSRA
jgi:chromosomal replication initiator protein